MVLASGVSAIELHPFFHFFPGSRSFGVGAAGCSAACDFCQNWELALAPRLDAAWQGVARFDSAAQIVCAALENGCGVIALTYNEPTVWPELFLDLAETAHSAGLKVVALSSGFLTATARAFILPQLDALKIDLKGHNQAFYRRHAGIDLRPVLDTLAAALAAGVWCEVSTVIIPGANDTDDAVDSMATHLLDVAGPGLPWHLQRFFPAYKRLNEAIGDREQLRRLRTRAIERGLPYVYLSNLPQDAGRHSFCATCGALVAERSVGRLAPLAAQCYRCGAPIPGRGLIAPNKVI